MQAVEEKDVREDGVEKRNASGITQTEGEETTRTRRRCSIQRTSRTRIEREELKKNSQNRTKDHPPTEEKTEVPSLFSHYKKPHLFLLRLLLLRLFSTSIMDEMRGRSGLDPKRVTESNVHSNYIIVCSQLRV